MKKKFLAIALCLVMLMLPLATVGVHADPAEGYTFDDASKTYTVTTADGLIAVAALINGSNGNQAAYNITLAADIDLAGKTWTSIGTASYPYRGTFDGANFTVKNLTVLPEKTDEVLAVKNSYVSLLGHVNEGCTVKNLKITGFNLQGVEFVSALIAESAQKDTNDAASKVTIENVHVRETTLVGWEGDDNGQGESGGIRKSYTGVLLGKAGAHYTLVNGCSVVATATGDCRVTGVIGGESVGSGVKTAGVTIQNTIVAGSYTHTGVSGGGAAGLFGYHSTIPVTVTNCVSLANLVLKKGSTLGQLAFDMNKMTLVAENCVFGGAPFGKVSDSTMGTQSMSNIYIYKDGATETQLSVLDTEFKAATNVSAESKLTIGGTEVLWSEAKLPVLNSAAALGTTVSAMFAGNPYITTAIIEEIVGHVHSYTVEKAEAAFLKTAATCTESAVYYKTCACGSFDPEITFTSGDPAGHKPSDKWTNSDEEHWHICSACLEEKSDVGTHSYGEWVVTKEPTTKREGERAKTCTVCEHEITEKIARLVATEEPATTPADETKGGGCGGTIVGFGAIALISLGACTVCMKKKES